MQKNDLIKLVRGQALLAGMNLSGQQGLIEDAVTMAAPFVWKSYGWRFRRRTKTVTTVGDQEYVNLPEDFDGFIGLTYRGGSSEGWQLDYYDEDTFEYFCPNPDLLSNDALSRVKITKETDSNQWRAYFSPEPDDTYSLTLIYTIGYGSLNDIPQGFEGLLVAAVWMFIYRAGTPEWLGAKAGYDKMLEYAVKHIDPVYRAIPGVTRRASRFNPDGSGNVPDDWYKVSDGSDY